MYNHGNSTAGFKLLCKKPLWRVDDFSLCFRTSYLQVIFPLSLVAVSLFVFFAGTLFHLVRRWRSSKPLYKPLHHEHIPSRRRPSVHADPIESNSETTSSSDAATDEDEDGFGEHLSLRRTMSRTSAAEVKIDRPRHGYIRVALEEITVAAQVALHVAAFMIHKEGDWVHGRMHILGGVVTWAYILILATIRLYFSRASRNPILANLWGHTATLYLFDFFFTAVRFRSVLIHDYPSTERSIVISEFALVTFLLFIAFTGRRGNQAVRQEYVDGLEPSREPLASLLSLATFSWVDPVVWHGYWNVFEMKDVWNLREDDHAVNLLSNYRQMKKTFSLALTLAKYFQNFLWLQGAWTLIYAVFMYAPTLILREVLEYVQDSGRYPANVAWLLVSMILVTGFITSIGNNQALYVGRRICIRLRAVIIGEVYAKALRRKAAASAELTLGKAAKEKDKDAKKGPKDEESLEDDDEQDAGQVNVGAIINLMSVDSFKVAEICAYLHYLLAGVPIQIIIAAALLYAVMGWSSIAGILAMLCLLPVNYYISRSFSRIQDKIMAATDKRIHATNEVLQNVRIIKYFAWEQRYEGVVGESRTLELRQLRNRYILWAFAAAIWYASPVIITFISFFVYTVVEERELRAPVAFTALSLFQLLRIPLDQLADMITNVLQAKVSVDRVAEFLAEEETEKYQQLKHDEVDANAPLIGFKDGNFSWGSRKSLNRRDGPQAFQLIDLNIEFVPEKLNVIAGPTGSGKTSLLMALLGEMTKVTGEVYLPGSHSREDLYPDENGLTESVAYCAQQAWLVNDTIRANILFARDYNEERYKAVIAACSLEKDLQIFEDGDETEIGEKGITLSGGQKQRISLARALYSSSKHLLLDDCLSAVDSHTAKHIYEHCIKGPLMDNRTCILVTHNVALCIPRSEFVVVMSNGRVSAQGTPAEIVASGALGADEYLKTAVSSRINSQAPSRVPSSTALSQTQDVSADDNTNGNGDTNGKPKKTQEERMKEKEEFKSEGSVDWQVYKLYLKSMGGWFFWLIVAAVFLLQQLGSIATSIWIRQWAVQYEKVEDQAFVSDVRLTSHAHADYSFSGSCAASGTCAWTFPIMLGPYQKTPDTINIQKEHSKVDVMYYLTVYAILGLVYAFLSLVREAIVFAGSLVASRRIHNQLLTSILRAKFRFFDTTPLGRIMNRFSRDLEAVDQEISWVALGTLHSIISVIAIIILISSITPQFLVAGLVITILYGFIGNFYLKASRDLKRLESIQRSPLYQHFGETLSGITTIRAYGDERRFVRENLEKIDTLNRPFFYLWVCNRWLSFRVDTAASFVAFFSGVFVILSVGKIDSGLAGLAMTYALSFNENILWTVRLYAMNEQNMNSVERLREYLEVEQEAAAIIEDHRPPSQWPEKGALEFDNYSTRYRPDLDQVLKKVSFSVAPLEKVGIVGRTGAGKSSLALALFRALEAEEGKIVLDNINIGEIGLHDLRSNITMVPQDPTLFTGTVRSNLDPFGIYTDEEIFTSLKRVHLIDEEDIDHSPSPAARDGSSSSPVTPTTPINKNIFTDLSSPITESGGNLSQGQRQLLCLARALLKKPKVIVMDEATASIDYSTDSKIQATIREMEASLLTIAHRLNTIVDYDRVLVLDQGSVKEYDHAHVLLNKEDSMFREMCEHSGELETLKEMAKAAWERKHPKLVDVE